jgi:hypothetical protein
MGRTVRARLGRTKDGLRYWWTDDQDPAAAEGVHPGAKSVNRRREAYLRDLAERTARIKPH